MIATILHRGGAHLLWVWGALFRPQNSAHWGMNELAPMITGVIWASRHQLLRTGLTSALISKGQVRGPCVWSSRCAMAGDLC